MANADRMYNEMRFKAHLLIDRKLEENLGVLKRVLPVNNIVKYLDTMIDSLDNILNEYITESVKKEHCIEIETEKMLNEAQQLACALGVELKLNRKSINEPATVFLSKLDKTVAELKFQLHEDRQKIIELQEQQEKFSNALREVPLPKPPDHLTTKNVLEELDKNFKGLVEKAQQRIMKLCITREELFDEKIALKIKSSDPNRFKNRQGQLLKDEKERKTNARKLFKIEEQIRDIVTAYQNYMHQPFLINGQDVLEYIDDTSKSNSLT